MRVLVVNNETSFFEALTRSLAAHEVTVVPWTEVTVDAAARYDAVVFSGGHGASVRRRPELFAAQIELFRLAPKPMLGVCLGFEVMAYAYGAAMTRRNHRIKGIYPVEVTRPDPIFHTLERFEAFESHRFTIADVPPPLEVLARSRTGVEVIKLRDKPVYGVQFHPEMAQTATAGSAIVGNFLRIASHYSHL